MADNIAAYGFRWVGNLAGKNVVPMLEYVQSGYQGSPGGNNIDLFPGDPVIRVTGSGNNPGGVIIATSGGGQGVAGVIVGIGPYFAAAPINAMVPGGTQLPGNTVYGTKFERASQVWVVPADGAIFEGDVDDNVTFTTWAGYLNVIGKNVDLSINNVANDTHAYPKLKIATQATTNTLQCRILGVSQTIANQDFSGKNVKLLFTFNVVQVAPIAPLGV